MRKKTIYLGFLILVNIIFIGCKENKTIPMLKSEQIKVSSSVKENTKDINTIKKGSGNTIKKDYEVNPKTVPMAYKIGDSGEAIFKIQNLLKTFGYNITVDGNYGLETKQAVEDFQTRNGLEVDGEIGEITFSLLEENPTDKTKYNEIDYSKFDADTIEDKQLFMNENTFYSDTPYFIIVNLNKKEVNIFEGENKNWKLINTFLCDIGMPSSPTITGRYRINLKGESFGQDKGYKCKYYTQIHEGILFHSIIYNLDGSVRDGRLGYAISHGCIRLDTDNAKWIYDYIPKDTQIILR